MSPSPTNQGIATTINLQNVLTIETNTPEIQENTDHTRGITRMSACTIATPHAKTKRIGIGIEMTNLAETIGYTPRLLTARTVKVDIKLTMWR